jgi:stage III sporulation protein AH
MKLKAKNVSFKPLLIIITLFLLTISLAQFFYIQKLNDEKKQDFFVQARSNRRETFDRSTKVYKKIIDDENASQEARKEILKKYTELISFNDMENKIETILESKGFEDSFASIINDRATISVRNENRKITDKNLKVIRDVITEISNIKDVEIIERD